MAEPARDPPIALTGPFRGVRPERGRAQEVIAPLYDVVDAGEARRCSEGKPFSFLHVSKAEIDLPRETDPYSDAVYAKARANFDAMLDNGVLRQDDEPCYYVYRVESRDARQTGVVAATSIDAYLSERIRRHELTQPDRENDRTRQIERLNAHTGPVLLTYRRRPGIDAVVAQIVDSAPESDVRSDDGVRHVVWVVRDAATIELLTRHFDAIDRLYIADGHHRTAAAARVAKARRNGSGVNGARRHDRFLAILVPDREVRIVDYNRAVKDLNGLSPDAFVDRTRTAFDVTRGSSRVRPSRRSEFGMYVDGSWYRLRARDGHSRAQAAFPRLDVDLLHDAVLAPILGIGDPRLDSRLTFVGGGRGLSDLERRVNEREVAVAFALYPTTLADMMTVADAGGVMPPKSTCFEPKVVDGLISYVLD